MSITRAAFLKLLVLAASIWGGGALAADPTTPFERATSTPRGELKNPYADVTGVAAEGLKIYRSLDCGGCHGGGGGGGMAAPLTNAVWVYGKDDDTLFRLIALGTGNLSPGDAFKKQGFVRKGSENVVAPMPPYGAIIKTDDEIWKIITWIRSVDCEQQSGGC
jgi:mono/diheme cytochrome c family protein